MVMRFRALTVNPRRINVAKITPEITAYMEGFLQSIIDSIKDYPPEVPDSRYVRREFEGGLLGSWYVSKLSTQGNLIEMRIINAASDRRSGRRYMAFVQGQFQTMLHNSTGWKRVDEAVDASRRRYRRELQAIYTKHINRGP